MSLAYEMVQISNDQYRRFIPWPGPVLDGTHRCIACGQIDDEPYHDHEVCQQSRINPSQGLLTPADVEREAHKLGRTQRSVILGLSADWGTACDHAAARRLWYREPRLVDHKSRTNNCWALTQRGEQVREYLARVAEQSL